MDLYTVPETETRFVAFIDILGYKEILKDKTLLPKIVEIMNYAGKLLDKYAQIDKSFELEVHPGYEYKIISDSILISIRADHRNIGLFLYILSHIQDYFLLTGILIRGAVTIGDYYYKDEILFSTAFVEAYNLESKEAVFPRIIVSKNFCQYVQDYYKTINIFNEEYEKILDKRIINFENNKINVIIDYCNSLIEYANSNLNFNENAISKISNVLDKIIKKLKNSKKNIKKIIVNWHADYFTQDLKDILNAIDLTKAAIVQDFDKQYFIDYLYHIFNLENLNENNKVENWMIKQIYEETDSKILRKLEWLSKYFNHKSEYYKNNTKIDSNESVYKPLLKFLG